MTSTAAVEAALRSSTDQRAAGLLALREDQWFEKKSSRIDARALAQSLVAMANADGGTLIVGLHGNLIDGVDGIGGKLNDLQQASRDFCEPRVPETSKVVDCIFRLERRKLLVFGSLDPQRTSGPLASTDRLSRPTTSRVAAMLFTSKGMGHG